MNKILKFILALVSTFAAGAVGSLATIPNIPTWYASLEKPVFNPPNWVFGPVWSLLYLLMGISLYIMWITAYGHSKQRAWVWFAVQLVLNVLWSIVFFGLHAPEAGVLVILLLLLCIILTIHAFWPISKQAAYLLFPYAAWVSFAAILNASIAVLN